LKPQAQLCSIHLFLTMANNSMHCLSSQKDVGNILPPILITEFLLGLPGNAVALWIFCFRMNLWKPSTVYLFNLVVADFLLIISLPFRIDNLMRGENWVFGDAMCRINLFMLAVNRSASISFMTIIAIDRYFKVVHPHHFMNHLSAMQGAIVSGLMWALVLSLRIPLLTNQLLYEHGNDSLCRSFSSYKEYSFGIKLHYVLYIAEFFLPLFLLLFCTFKIVWILKFRKMDKDRKVRRAIVVIGVIVGVFALCFMPGIVTGIVTLLIQKYRPGDCFSFLTASSLFSLSIGFTYLNSALDPVIYCFSSPLFTKALKTAFNTLGLCHLEVDRRGSVTSEG
ncbi:HCAR2 protein, partial [Atractosteus spatula]|nr:HCAR2 protein [Atractosteus spatula]